MRKPIASFMFSPFLTSAALAHDGHGLLGAHWHVADVVGFVVFAALIGMVIWHVRK
jgi:hypothetical protein